MLGVVCPPEEAGPGEVWHARQALEPVATHTHAQTLILERKWLVIFFFPTDLGLLPVLPATCFILLCLPCSQSARRWHTAQEGEEGSKAWGMERDTGEMR